MMTEESAVAPDVDQTIVYLIENNILPILVRCLKTASSETLQHKAACASTNFVFGGSNPSSQFVTGNVVNLFFRLLSSSLLDQCEDDAYDLSKFVCYISRESFKDLKVAQELLSFVKPDASILLLRLMSNVIVSVWFNELESISLAIFLEVIRALNVLLDRIDPCILDNVFELIDSCDSNMDYDRLQMIIGSGMVQRLIRILDHADARIQISTLRGINRIVRDSEEMIQFLLDYDILSYYLALISHSNKCTREDAAFQLSFILSNDGIPRNIKSDQIVALKNAGVISVFCNMLDPNNSEECVLISLQGLHTMLCKMYSYGQPVEGLIKECSSLLKIKLLQYHEDPRIAYFAKFIINECFSEES